MTDHGPRGDGITDDTEAVRRHGPQRQPFEAEATPIKFLEQALIDANVLMRKELACLRAENKRLRRCLSDIMHDPEIGVWIRSLAADAMRGDKEF